MHWKYLYLPNVMSSPVLTAGSMKRVFPAFEFFKLFLVSVVFTSTTHLLSASLSCSSHFSIFGYC